ncbi:MAG: D-Ala-D-Ala dipeptidase [Zetaproteobacteria bacterium]|nr:MAG: D-Ala-D-Ala dipeptidase [Zetaproteobacteria bacterium]
MRTYKNIQHQDLICMNAHTASHDYYVDLTYARNDSLLFGERIYRKDARLWLHTLLAEVVKNAAIHCFKNYNLHFILYDGLRTINAQDAMMNTTRAKNNPHWTKEPRLLSRPGAGGHPRGMAIDIGLKHPNGTLTNMGTDFDYLSEDPKKNPAHRTFPHDQDIINNRKILDVSMQQAANALNTPLLLLPEEWWDFRLPPDIYEQYAPLSDDDLPVHMRLVNI